MLIGLGNLLGHISILTAWLAACCRQSMRAVHKHWAYVGAAAPFVHLFLWTVAGRLLCVASSYASASSAHFIGLQSAVKWISYITSVLHGDWAPRVEPDPCMIQCAFALCGGER